MPDLNDRECIVRGEKAQQALTDFLAPAFAAVEAEYAEKMITAAASSDPRAPDIIARLANGIKALRGAKAHVEVIVMDAELTKAAMIRAEKINAMTPAARSLVKIGAH